MANPPEESRRPAQQGESSPARTATPDSAAKKGPRVGDTRESDRTSQQNAGSTEGGGTRNAGNTVERRTENTVHK
jgi:hypothetical protein